MDWKKYFDRIYCIHHLLQKAQMPRLRDELTRVGILDSGIFEFRYTVESPYDKIIFEAQKCAQAPSVSFVNLCMEVRKCLAEAVAFGYKRILMLENDVCFLRDVKELESAIAETPTGYGIVQYDKFVNDTSVVDYKERLAKRMINQRYFDGTRGFYTSAACVGLFNDGITEMLRVMNEHICATDIAYQLMNCRYAIAAKNLAIQVFHQRSFSVEREGIEYMHSVYKNANVDYSEYAVPDGYDYGKVISIKSEDEEDFKVSVYAIALNEERFAERWYNCFKEADEVCVLDTGSSDKTVEILTRLGAKVTVKKYDKWTCLPELDALIALGGTPWRFDAARNEAMNLCSKDSTLLFCADMDDVIEPGWKERLRKIWERGKVEGAKTEHVPNCVLYTYSVVYKTDEGEQRQSFVRHGIHTPNGWQWEDRCHEHLEYVGGSRNFVYAPDFKFESRPETKDHSNYLPLLEADVRDGSADGRSLHLYARELMQNGRYDEAILWFKRHLACKGATWSYERAASMKFIANCYASKGDSERSELWLWRASAEDPHDRDAPFTLGRLLGQMKEYKLAQKVLTRCISIKEQHPDYPAFTLEAWTERPFLSLAECYFYDGLWDQALEYAQQALKQNPTSKMAAITVNEIKDYKAKNPPLPLTKRTGFRIDIPTEK